jgi:CDGSH iron-sulfur domain-containing protein 3
MPDVKIEIRANGPYRVTGPIEIVDQQGKAYTIPEGQWVSLCRCGSSEKKPFCDSSHRTCGFNGPSEAY